MPPRNHLLVLGLGAAFLMPSLQGCSHLGPGVAGDGPEKGELAYPASPNTPAPAPQPTPPPADPPARQEPQPPREPASAAPDKLVTTHCLWGTRQEGCSAAGGGDPGDRLDRDLDLVWEDYRHYYTPANLGALALGIGLAAPIANTSADQSIRRWYQKRIRGETTDEWAQLANYGGQFWVAVPAGLELAALAGWAPDFYRPGSALEEWSCRSIRSILVGAPPMVALYAILGSSRPDRNDSHWHPFQDVHGVSGHTFMGAVPFLTAAGMTDDPLLKYPLVLGSFLTGWSRINNDRHYFSQVALGWWMAYLAVRRVEETPGTRKCWSVLPTLDDGPGVAVRLEY